ncbi:MAG: hypothetical protein ACKO15_06970 [Burkholderiales bacterium]
MKLIDQLATRKPNLGSGASMLSHSRKSAWKKLALSALSMTVLAGSVIDKASAQISGSGGENDPPLTITYSVAETYHVDANGVIRLVSTGQVMTAQEVIDKLGPAGALAIGIIVGAGQGAAGAIVTGASARQVFLAAGAGAIGGYYGALASLTTGVVRIMYGTAAVGFGGAGTAVVTTQPTNNVASCNSNPPGPGCFMVIN